MIKKVYLLLILAKFIITMWADNETSEDLLGFEYTQT